jgi:hypothetical protein
MVHVKRSIEMKKSIGLQRVFLAVARILLVMAVVFSGITLTPSSVVLAGSAPTSSKPGETVTSAFLIGKVAVGVVFPENSGNPWAAGEKTNALSQIQTGLDRWTTFMTEKSGSKLSLNFVVDDINLSNNTNYPESVATTVDPITTNVNLASQAGWINQALAGYTAGSSNQQQAAKQRMYDYINKFRNNPSVNADWGFIIFVVRDSSSYSTFNNSGRYFYSDLYGPYTVVTYGAGALGSYTYLNLVISREVAHLFGASYHDNDCVSSAKYGYLAITNGNCTANGSLMDPLSTGMTPTPDAITYQQVGWLDSSNPNNGIFDPVDTKPVVVMTSHISPDYSPLTYSDPAYQNYVVYDTPYSAVPCPGGQCYYQAVGPASIAINKIHLVEYSIDNSGTWDPASEDSIYSYDASDYLAFKFTTAVLTGGQHIISARAINSVGNISSVVSDPVYVIGSAGNNDIDQALDISNLLSYAEVVDVKSATLQAEDPTTNECNSNRQGLNSIWYKFTATKNAPLYLDTFGSDYDTYISVWTYNGSTFTPIPSNPPYNTMTCNDDYGGELTSYFAFVPNAGNTYYIELAKFGDTSKGGDAGSGELHFRASLNIFAPVSRLTTSFDYSHGWTVTDYPRMLGDVNGDGKDDLFGFGLDGVYVATSTGSGFSAISRWTTDFDYAHGWRVSQHPRMVGDVNGDGNADLVGFGLDGVYIALSTGTGFDPISRWTTDFDYLHGWRVDQHPRMVGDVNGDKKADLIGFGLDGVYVALSNGISFDSVSRWTTAFDYSHGWRVDQHPRMVGDVNGDKMADLVGFGLDGVYIALSNGISFDPVSRWTTSFDYSHGWRVDQHPRMVGDVNGDKKADLIGFGLDGAYVALSTGSGFGPINRWTTDLDYSHGWRVSQHPRTVGDVNGDGMNDIVGFGLDGVYVGSSK